MNNRRTIGVVGGVAALAVVQVLALAAAAQAHQLLHERGGGRRVGTELVSPAGVVGVAAGRARFIDVLRGWALPLWSLGVTWTSRAL